MSKLFKKLKAGLEDAIDYEQGKIKLRFFIFNMLVYVGSTYTLEKNMTNELEVAEYVTIMVTVPETHAEVVREAMGKAGAGKIGNYSFCSFSTKGIGRFMPSQHANPYIGNINTVETVIEEKIETVCHTQYLEQVLEAIKKVHPYETAVIDIIPVYKMGIKL